MHVPQIDLRRQHGLFGTQILEMTSRALADGCFAGGPEVDGFEREFAGFLGGADLVAVSSGTAALRIALRALGLGPGDEVVLPSHTFIATAEAVVMAGASPVFCDVEPDTGLVSHRTMEAALTPNTRALIPVHLYGHVVDMKPILDLARTHGLHVIEDAAQAHGARYLQPDGCRIAGTIGHAGCFSFYPTKNLGGIGEGGAIAFQDPDLAVRARQLRDHGQTSRHVHDFIGDNSRMGAIQAGALRIKLPRLDGWNDRRREIARTYARAIEDLPVRAIPDPGWSLPVYHQFVIRVPERDRWRAALGELGVGTGVHYPTPIHHQPAFAFARPDPGTLPVTERWAAEVISLPMFPEITEAELAHTVRALSDVAEHLRDPAVSIVEDARTT